MRIIRDEEEDVGQPIEVQSTTVVGDVALFATDRTFGGQEGESYTTLDEARASDTYPSLLAERLFLADGAIRRVYVYSNALSVQRADGWTEDDLEDARQVIRNFFVIYDENRV